MDKRILHCIASLDGGGAERQLAYLCPELIGSGWEVHVALLRYGTNYKRIEHTATITHKIRHRNNYDLMLLWNLYKIAKKVQPAIIQTWLPMMDILGGMVAKLIGTRWILSERSAAECYSSDYKDVLRRVLGRRSDMILANSSTGLHYWKGWSNTKASLDHIPNALPINEITNAQSVCKTKFEIGAEQKVILYVGRLVQLKNVDKLIEALSKISNDIDAILVICGEGPLSSALEQRARDLGVSSRCFFLGHVPNVYDWMKAADVVALLSDYEGMPNELMEAAACGCPLIVSDISTHHELFTDEMAWFCHPQRSETVAEALKFCLNEHDATQKKADIAKLHFGTLTPNRIAKEYEKRYLQLLGV